jgi:ABC-type transporter Mla maintaining outer membrane lipid asymmetry ATPase subunit MlaF
MNLKLVESLAQIINSLTPEEQELLIQKTSIKNGQEQDLGEIQTMKVVKKQGKLFEPPLADYIQITRDERTAQQDELIQEIIKEKRVNEK